MKRVQDWLLRFRWQKLLLVWGVFLLIAAVLFAERSGVQYTHTRFRLSYLPQEQAISKAQALQEQPATCLLLCDTRQSGVDDARELFTQLLQDMKVAADVVDLAEVSVNDLPAPENYQTAVVLMPNVEPLGEELLRLMNWVEDGGGLLFGMSPSNDRYLMWSLQNWGCCPPPASTSRQRALCRPRALCWAAGSATSFQTRLTPHWQWPCARILRYMPQPGMKRSP